MVEEPSHLLPGLAFPFAWSGMVAGTTARIEGRGNLVQFRVPGGQAGNMALLAWVPPPPQQQADPRQHKLTPRQLTPAKLNNHDSHTARLTQARRTEPQPQTQQPQPTTGTGPQQSQPP